MKRTIKCNGIERTTDINANYLFADLCSLFNEESKLESIKVRAEAESKLIIEATQKGKDVTFIFEK